MNLFSKIIFFGFLLLIFLFEGLGLVDRQIALFTVYLMPFFLSFFLLFEKKPLQFPKRMTVLFLLFLLFSAISLIFSINIERSFYFLVYYLAVFLIFVYVFNFKDYLKKEIIIFTFFITFVFFIYSLILFLPLPKNWSFLIPIRDYQFVYQVYSTHHPLGIFLIIPLSLILPIVSIKRKVWIYIFLILFIAMIFSYFRSSYFAFIFAFIFLVYKNQQGKKINWIKIFFASLLIIFITLLFFSLTNYEKPTFLLSNINQFFQTHFNLKYKSFFSGRDEFWLASIKGFTENPLFGVGLGNFSNLSLKSLSMSLTADSSNLFLDFFAETGFFGGLFFLIIVLKIFFSRAKNFNKDDVYSKMIFISFLALIFFFQTGPGKHYSLILYFFTAGALIYEEEEKINCRWLFFLISVFIAFIIHLIFMSKIYLKIGQPLLAFYHFPFQKTIYQPLIEKLEEKGEIDKAGRFLNTYATFFFGETDVINYVANNYEKKGKKEKALFFYEKSYYWDRFQGFSLIEKIYRLKKQSIGEEETKQFIKKFLSEYYVYKKASYLSDQLENRIETDIKKICVDLIDNKECHFLNIKELKYFSEPEANTIKKEEDKVYKAKYTINKDTLNERLNYPIKKEKGVYRIMALGDSLTYGKYINTDKNWTELFEDRLNKDNKCSNIKKFEVINLGVDGYDIEYTVERYKTRGEKYNPDLIIWPIRSFYRINELINRKTEYLEDNNKEKLNEDEIWEKAKNEVREELGDQVILKKQKQQLNQLPPELFKKTIFVNTSDINENERKILPSDSKIFGAIIPENEYYPNTGVFNPQGHEAFSEEIFDYFKDGYSSINVCLKP